MRYELKNEQAQKVGIGQAPKLLEQIERQEGQQVVFGRGNMVVLDFFKQIIEMNSLETGGQTFIKFGLPHIRTLS